MYAATNVILFPRTLLANLQVPVWMRIWWRQMKPERENHNLTNVSMTYHLWKQEFVSGSLFLQEHKE